MGSREICARRTYHFFGIIEFDCSYGHVHVLHDKCNGASISEVFVVEEVYYNDAVGEDFLFVIFLKTWNLTLTLNL